MWQFSVDGSECPQAILKLSLAQPRWRSIWINFWMLVRNKKYGNVYLFDYIRPLLKLIIIDMIYSISILVHENNGCFLFCGHIRRVYNKMQNNVWKLSRMICFIERSPDYMLFFVFLVIWPFFYNYQVRYFLMNRVQLWMFSEGFGVRLSKQEELPKLSPLSLRPS